MLTMYFNLIISNTAATSPDVFGSGFSGNHYNFVGDATGSSGFSGTDILTFAGSVNEVVDTTLRDDGGNTQTFALMPGSPAIDAVPNGIAGCDGTPPDDQRGEMRPVDYDLDSVANCDIGAFERQVDETWTAVLNAGDTRTFGATLTTISDNNAGGNVPGNVMVTRTNQPPGGGVPETGEMPFYVTITPDTDSGLDVDLTLCYTDWEVAQGGSVVEAGLQLFRYTGAGGVWSPVGADVVDTVNNCVTKYNVTQLSSWTLGNLAPTAVSLESMSGGLHETAVSYLVALAASLLGGFTLLLLRRRQMAMATQKHHGKMN
ncbi:MAG: choice-of-anchor Q domain-containing protein [Chloroflexota bacterium]